MIRRGYRTKAVLVPGGPPVTIRWFFAPEGAKNAPTPSWFVPKIFDEKIWGNVARIGDLPARAPQWDDAGNPLGYTGLDACGSPEAWAGAGFPGASYPVMTTDA